MNPIYFSKLLPERYYHIYNRSNDGEILFDSSWQYELFLRKYQIYLSEYVDTFAYCILNNHFHFLIRCKPLESIIDCLNNKSHLNKLEEDILVFDNQEVIYAHLLKNQFAKLFISYAMIINKSRTRRGNLFHRPFKRKEIENENHFSYLIYYIHKNGIKHRVFKSFETYPWSSYQSIVSNNSTFVNSQEVLDWFGDKQSFIEYHRQEHIWNITK